MKKIKDNSQTGLYYICLFKNKQITELANTAKSHLLQRHEDGDTEMLLQAVYCTLLHCTCSGAL